jgi:flagellar biosynthesis protein
MFTRRMRFIKDYADSEPARPGAQKLPTTIALGYNPNEDVAPVVLASGRGAIAEKIIALGKENNIPVIEDPLLASALADIDIGTVIPPELYAVVAEVLAYVYRIPNRR